MRVLKRLLELTALVFASRAEPDPIFLRDPRVAALAEVLEVMRKLEPDPRMRLRWWALRRLILWLVTNDGAYRIRAIRLAQEIAARREVWKIRPWECRYWERKA